MRRLPWRVAVRADRKAVLTAVAISLGVAFSIVGLAVPAGLATETISPDGPYAGQDALISRPAFEPFDAQALGLPDATTVLLLEARAAPDNRSVTLVALVGPRAENVSQGEARPGGARAAGTTLHLVAPSAASFTVGARVDSPLVARAWWVVAEEDLRALAPELSEPLVTYALAPHLEPGRTRALERDGYVVAAAPGVEPFFRASTSEVARDLVLVVMFSSILVALFAYEFLRSEVREKRREIGLWRAVGMRANDVMALLLARAGAISAAGILLGSGLSVLALRIAGWATGSGIFDDGIPVLQLALTALAFLVAGLLGGAVPAWLASRGRIRDQMEAAA